MSNHATRLARLEALQPSSGPMHVLHVIIDPDAPDDRATEVLACGPDGLVGFPRLLGETKEQMCERAERAMGWLKEDRDGRVV